MKPETVLELAAKWERQSHNYGNGNYDDSEAGRTAAAQDKVCRNTLLRCVDDVKTLVRLFSDE